MKKFRNPFKRYAKGGINKPVVGITTEEWATVYTAIEHERDVAKQRQRRADGKPSDFMRGLNYALSILDKYHPHVIKEVQ